jgi:peptide/nickel transport system permease protein
MEETTRLRTAPIGYVAGWRASAGWRMFFGSSLTVVATAWLAMIVVVALAGPYLFADEANQQNLALRFFPPFSLDRGLAFVLGADSLGRPILLQLVIGARTSVIVATVAVTISATLGYAIGLMAGYFGGWLDTVLLRIADVLHTVPSLLLALVVLFVLEPSVVNLIVVLGITRISVYLRTARAQTLELRERTFVEVARSIGASHWRIVSRDIAPLVFPTIRTLAVLEISTVILASASLTFLGIGLQRPDVDWGMMVADGRAYLKSAWFVTVFPGVVIVMTALAANIVSNWLRAVEDPTQATLFVRRPRQRETA